MAKTITYWSLFERPRNSRGRWERVSHNSYTKQVAIRVFQDRLIASALCPDLPELSLRRVFALSDMVARSINKVASC